jgi:thiosulfate/3-mercaptopyruvate sulfurtransferase
MRSGHIPGAVNVYYNSLLRTDGTILPPAELQKIFAAAKLDLKKPIVTSCGGGVTACALLLGLERAGAQNVAVYDGSWSEWGARRDVPIEVG